MLVTVVTAVFVSTLSVTRPSPATLFAALGVALAFVAVDLAFLGSNLPQAPSWAAAALYLAFYATALSATMLVGALCMIFEPKPDMPLPEFLSGAWLADVGRLAAWCAGFAIFGWLGFIWAVVALLRFRQALWLVALNASVTLAAVYELVRYLWFN